MHTSATALLLALAAAAAVAQNGTREKKGVGWEAEEERGSLQRERLRGQFEMKDISRSFLSLSLSALAALGKAMLTPTPF